MIFNKLSMRAGIFGLTLAVASVIFSGPFSHIATAHAEGVSFITDGTNVLNSDSFMTENSYWRIDTGESQATYTPIAEDFFGSEFGGVGGLDLGDWTEAYNSDAGIYGDEDDSYVEIPVPFDFYFDGVTYGDVFVGSNSYLTFGRGSREYSSVTASLPHYPGVHVGTDDHSFQHVLYREDAPGVFRIRYEGTDDTSGTFEDPNIIFEAVFYEGETYFDLYIGDHADIGTLLDPSFHSSSEIDSYPVGYTVYGDTGTWDFEGDFSYQWERSSDNGDTWSPIGGAVLIDYTPTGADSNKDIRLAVTLDDGIDPPVTHYSVREEVHPVIEVSTCEELQDMDQDGGDDDAYVLTADIDCSGISEFSPLDWEGDDFGGSFDGQGHTIANLNIVGTDIRTGLFSYVDGGFIKDFTLNNVTVTGPEGFYTGAVVGEFDPEWDFEMSNVHVMNGSVTGSDAATGGLIGYIAFDEMGYTFDVLNSSYQGDVTSELAADVGGIIGALATIYNGDITLDQVYFNGTMDFGDQAVGNVGGIIGAAHLESGDLTLNQVAANGTINAPSGFYLGGLVGMLDVYDSEEAYVAHPEFYTLDCYADMDITGYNDVGGVIGNVQAAPTEYGTAGITIENTYAAGSITANFSFGGLIGYIQGTFEDTTTDIINSFASSTFPETGESWGGVIGYYEDGDYDPSLDQVYFNGDVMNLNRCDGGSLLGGCLNANNEGSDPDYFFDIENFPMNGWDFEGTWYAREANYPILYFTTVIPEPTSDFVASGHSRANRLEQVYGDDWEDVLKGSSGTSDDSNTSGGGGAQDDSTDHSSNNDPSDTPTDSAPEDSTPEDTTPDRPDYSGIDSHYDDYYGHEVAPESGHRGISPWDASSELISSVKPGWFIRGEHFDTVYEVIYDDATGALIRRPFWDVPTFFTYEDSWENVVWVTDATLATMKVGTPMTPKPGVVLVKVLGEPRVYAVAQGPALREITSEAIAVSVYGADWADYVIDMLPSELTLFTYGTNVEMGEVVNKGQMKTRKEIWSSAK